MNSSRGEEHHVFVFGACSVCDTIGTDRDFYVYVYMYVFCGSCGSQQNNVSFTKNTLDSQYL